MENLLKPDVGLMFWTVVTFLIMVLILKRLAWGPILKVLDEREGKIKNDLEATRRAKDDMERLKVEYEQKLLQIEARARDLLAQAEQKGIVARENIIKEAEAEAVKLAEKTRQQLELEKERLIRELRKDVGELSIAAAEKLLHQSVDKKVQDQFIQDLMNNLKAGKG